MQSGIFARLYVLLRNEVLRHYSENIFVKDLADIVDQAVQAVEQLLENSSGPDKYAQALQHIIALAKDGGIQLPPPDILNVYIEAAVKRLDAMSSVGTDPVVVATKHISGMPPKEGK